MDVKKLSRNTKVVAEALARVIYNLTEKVHVHRHADPWYNSDLTFSFLSSQPKGTPGDLQIFTEQMVSDQTSGDKDARGKCWSTTSQPSLVNRFT